jgi:hypothetical protein
MLRPVETADGAVSGARDASVGSEDALVQPDAGAAMDATTANLDAFLVDALPAPDAAPSQDASPRQDASPSPDAGRSDAQPFDSSCGAECCSDNDCTSPPDVDCFMPQGSCTQGTCSYSPYGFVIPPRRCKDDGIQCTADYCDLAGNCIHPYTNIGFPCDDGDPCTTNDRCNDHGCGGTALNCTAPNATCCESMCCPHGCCNGGCC